jgi:CRISPR/Cas system-associated exonuclease Cas4 (RecB family)
MALRRSEMPILIDPAEIAELIDEFTTTFTEIASKVPETQKIFVNKHLLTRILGCEVAAVAPEEFQWQIPIALGQIAHRAIQLGITWPGEPAPLLLVDEAIARVSDEDSSLGDWVAGLSTADRADLRGMANERVTKFVESFPPLDPRSHPMTESKIYWPTHGPITLSGKVDLVVGKPSGHESRKLIVDLKTGRPRPNHRDDLRFYALLETLRAKVPPRKTASFYLDAGDTDAEEVTIGILRSAARRALDGIATLVEITLKEREPVTKVSHACRWCPLVETCADGTAFLEDSEDL